MYNKKLFYKNKDIKKIMIYEIYIFHIYKNDKKIIIIIYYVLSLIKYEKNKISHFLCYHVVHESISVKGFYILAFLKSA